MTAAGESKRGKMGAGTKAALVLLALWAVISLVVIVVWSTSPDLKSSARCRQDLRETREKNLGAEALWAQDRDELEERLRVARERHERQEAALAALAQRLHAANRTLEECRAHQAVLMANISVLQEEAELMQQTQLNLTNRLKLQEDHVEVLEHNLTQSGHRAAACSSLKAAADNRADAAQTQTRACEADRDFLRKQLVKCQEAQPESAKPPHSHRDPAPPGSRSGGLSAAPGVVALAFWARLVVS
ncbi:uncharacterized protein si:ch211-1a19.3 [Syngnathoides biaculeatus]|uniref:uncharacterized protein si:ch211-1a19.3 n=1 Tax=Syngnathoides biaculeatus TaxID=300417 RepID=UPI002ADE6A29|nr:uncharacterized protein si:ch211-1a19.3 [Syngnathoides biaculeatus]